MAALHRNCERRELGRSRLAEVTNRNAEDYRALRNRVVALAIYPVVRSLEAKDVRPATDLLAAGDSAIGKSMKVIGIMQDGTLASVEADVRFAIADETTNAEEPAQLKVRYNGYLADKMNAGSHLVLTGSLAKDGIFDATKVELQE